MINVRDILRVKGRAVYSVSPGSTVFESLELMAEKNIGALVVLDHGQLAGIMSERDYARKVILKGKSSKDIPVSEIMTSEVISVRPETSVEECMALMTAHHIRHLPVFENEQLAGLISIGDVVKSIIEAQKGMIDDLSHYIMGNYPVTNKS